jgi:hypothetical protein
MSVNERVVLGIDPGDKHSALVTWDGEKILHATRVENRDAIFIITNSKVSDVAIEEIVIWGKAGKNIAGAIKWSGRFEQAAEFMGMDTHSLYRKTIAAHLTGLAKYGDSKIRASLIERFGPPPSKGCDNPVYNGCKIPDKKNDRWAAWAVAVTWWDKNCGGTF